MRYYILVGRARQTEARRTEGSKTMITKYAKGSKEYKALEAAAALLTATANRTVYKVDETYFDYGQGWKWTTVIAYRDDGGTWQALNPREHGLITDVGTVEAISEAVCLVRDSKYNPDK